VAFGGTIYAGEQPQIVAVDVWNRVQIKLNRNRRTGGREVRNKYGALLRGVLWCACCEEPLFHTYTCKGSRLYRYYVTAHPLNRARPCATRSVSAPDIEGAVVDQIRGIARHPAVIDEVMRSLPSETDRTRVARVLADFDSLWDQVPSRDQERLVKALLCKVTYDGRTGCVTLSFASQKLKEWVTVGLTAAN